MRAVVLPARNAALVSVDDHPEPTVDPAAGELILDVTACGVCHSDIHVVDDDFGADPPLVLGHEVTGVHPELGPVMLYAPWGCGSCPQCAEGDEMICSDATEAGLFTDGGYAERLRVPDVRYLAELGDLDPYASAPLACGGLTAFRAVLQGLGRLRAKGTEARALVIGAGGLGQYAIRFLRLLSDAEVTALDLSPSKVASARALGAHHGVEAVEPGPQFDVVIDFIGAESTLQTAIHSVVKKGYVVAVGLAGGTVPFGFGAVPLEARLVASVWGTRAQLDELLDLTRRERDSVLTPVEVMALADAEAAHQRLRSGQAEGRIVLDVSGGGR